MNPAAGPTAERAAGPAAAQTRPLVAAGIVALAVAMGIGRFAFTPLLPLMMRDGTIDAAGGAEWAAANYSGYLVGALSASRFGGDVVRWLRLALAGVAASTLLVSVAAQPLAGAALRFAAGAFSAWALVLASSACLLALARQGAVHRGAWIYTGVGLGIALAGTMTWLGGGQSAAALWAQMGLVAAGGTLYVARALPSLPAAAAGPARRPALATPAHAGLVACYGVFGFGYIVPATFLPALARARADNPLVFGSTWPLFGLAAAVSVAAAARWATFMPRHRLWAAAQAVMAVGTGLIAFERSLGSLALSALLVGGTFMLVTMTGLQLARQMAPDDPTPLLAKMTAAFAAGQIAGPLLVRALPSGPASGWDGTAVAAVVAAALLASSSIWLWRSKF